MLPTVKSAKLYAVLESTIQLKDCTPNELNEYLRKRKFGGQTEINYHQGGVTNIITREHIALTMQELEAILAGRQA
jgi:hypothetical protein